MKSPFVNFVFALLAGCLASESFAQIGVATGLGGAWTIREDYGEDQYWRFRGELPVYVYMPVAEPVWLRSGLRLGYTEDHPEMPDAIKIKEKDFSYALEAAVLWDWYVIPSLGFGYGVIERTIDLSTSDKLKVEDDDISNSETLAFWQTQFGVGIPVLDGLIVMEPFIRWWDVSGDNRSKWTLGFDVTAQVY